MRIAYAIPVRNIEVLHDGSLVALGIETCIVTAPLPTTVTAPIVLCLAAAPAEAQQGIDHPVSIRVLGPDLSEVAPSMTAPLQLEPGPNTPVGWEVRAVLPVAATFEATTPGTYSIEIGCGGKTISVPYVVNDLQADTGI